MIIRFDELSSFAESILRAVPVPEHKAHLVATSLVAANLRSVVARCQCCPPTLSS
jgi:LDH2 family malate/lactate/ureidoglycolate dehydrogenase